MVVKILPSLNTARLVRNFLTYSQLQITFIKGSPLEYYDESPKDIVILIINICYGYSLTMYRRRPTKSVKGLRRLNTLRHTAIRHRASSAPFNAGVLVYEHTYFSSIGRILTSPYELHSTKSYDQIFKNWTFLKNR